jgi:hypothetical protein
VAALLFFVGTGAIVLGTLLQLTHELMDLGQPDTLIGTRER